MGLGEVMTDRVVRVVDEPVKITDNGVRSFLPPTFCFELRNINGHLVDTVSQLVVVAPEQEGLRDFDALALLDRFRLWALGRILEYDAGPEARIPGRRFEISQCVNQP
jgi:hypothetical protein